MRKNIDKIYTKLLEDLRYKIESEHGSIAKFCKENNMCRFNLSKVFNRHQELSVSHYIRICVALGALGPGHNIDVDTNLTLKDYLRIDHHSVIQSILTMVLIG
jgi:hypothetical protein